MMFPIIAWLEKESLSPDCPVNFRARDLLEAKIGLVSSMSMPDYELELWCEKNKTLTSAGADVHDVLVSDLVAGTSAQQSLEVGATVEYVHPAVGVACAARVIAVDEDGHASLHVDAPAGSPEEPAELATKRASTDAAFAALSEKCRLFVSLVDPSNVEAFQKLRSDGNLNIVGLASAYPDMGIDIASLEALFDLAQTEMQRSNYYDASDYLTLFDEVAEAEMDATKLLLAAVPESETKEEEMTRLSSTLAKLEEMRFRVQWGLLVTSVLTPESDSGADPIAALKALRKTIDVRAKAKKVTPLEHLQQQTWLAHWAVWIFFSEKATTGASLLCDFFLAAEEPASQSQENRRNRKRYSPTNSYLNVVQSNCQWLLRYLAVAHIISTIVGRSRALAANEYELMRAIKMEERSYSGPIVEFVKRLIILHDLESAKDSLESVNQCLKADYFISGRRVPAAIAGSSTKDDGFVCQFMLAARKLVIELSCRIHEKLDLAQLAAKLNMEPAEAEQWMVKIIRSSEAQSSESGGDSYAKSLALSSMKGAKIDSLKSHIIMSADAPSVYAQLVQKTQGLQLRSETLCRYLTDPAGVQPRET
jgi:translation initiation factor 3 subunit E